MINVNDIMPDDSYNFGSSGFYTLRVTSHADSASNCNGAFYMYSEHPRDPRKNEMFLSRS